MTKHQLLTALRAYDNAAIKFIQKVESGQARSVTSYAELKTALEASRKAQRGV